MQRLQLDLTRTVWPRIGSTSWSSTPAIDLAPGSHHAARQRLFSRLAAEHIALTEPGRIHDEIDTVGDLLQRSDESAFERDAELLPLALEVLTELWSIDREGVVRDADRAGRAVGRVQVPVLVCEGSVSAIAPTARPYLDELTLGTMSLYQWPSRSASFSANRRVPLSHIARPCGTRATHCLLDSGKRRGERGEDVEREVRFVQY